MHLERHIHPLDVSEAPPDKEHYGHEEKKTSDEKI